MRRSYRFLTRNELAKLELNLSQKTDGGPEQPLAPPVCFLQFPGREGPQ
jgi:hypothetical protein